MTDIQRVLKRNRAWAEQVALHKPEFFERLSQKQTPDYL